MAHEYWVSYDGPRGQLRGVKKAVLGSRKTALSVIIWEHECAETFKMSRCELETTLGEHSSPAALDAPRVAPRTSRSPELAPATHRRTNS